MMTLQHRWHGRTHLVELCRSEPGAVFAALVHAHLALLHTVTHTQQHH